MPQPTERARVRIATSAYDRVASLLISLLGMTAVVVASLLLIYFGSRLIKPTLALPVKPIALPRGGGGGNGMQGSGDTTAEFDAPNDEPAVEAPQIRDTLDVIASAVTQKSSLLANEQLDTDLTPAQPQEFGDTRKRGLGEGGEGRGPGFGSGTGSGRGPGSGGGFGGGVGQREPDREIRFEPSNLAEYAAWLDYFHIELGVLGQDNKVYYAYNLGQKTPSVREGAPADEQRLFMNSARSRFAGLDKRLVERAGIAKRGKIILQFFPAEAQQVLYALERARAESAGKKPEDVRRTVFRVTRNKDKFEFSVQEQLYR